MICWRRGEMSATQGGHLLAEFAGHRTALLLSIGRKVNSTFTVRRGEDVVQDLERVCRHARNRKAIRVDQGSEFISRDLGLWAYQRGVDLDISRPDKPTDNAFIESLYGMRRAERLNTQKTSSRVTQI